MAVISLGPGPSKSELTVPEQASGGQDSGHGVWEELLHPARTRRMPSTKSEQQKS